MAISRPRWPKFGPTLAKIAPPGWRRIAIPVALCVVIAGLTVGLLVSGGSTPARHVAAGSSTSSTTTSSTLPYLGRYHCPLTDLPVPSGVPNRPALAVKVGNEPGGARPQSGLNEADIVYDTPAEGFVMRYIMVFQCNNASQIGPNRSVRWVDQRIVREFGNPILAYAGGIDPNLASLVTNKWVYPANLLGNAAQAGIRTTTRSAPDNLYTSTSALYAMFPKAKTPPPSVFLYTPSLPSIAQPASSFQIDFSYDTDAVWTWNPSGDDWLHAYGSEPDIDALSNQRVSASNVIVQIVSYKIGPYSEHGPSSGDIESKTRGSGPAYLFRDGKEIKVTWHRLNYTSPTTFTDAEGKQVGLAPGRTWVELLPNVTAAIKGAFTITK